jgi:hypothetical protein
MKATKLFEELQTINPDEKLIIELNGNNINASDRHIKLYSRRSIGTKTLKEITELVEKHEARLTFSPTGIMNITFKGGHR